MAAIQKSGNLGYSAEDIMEVLQIVKDQTTENRDRALRLYDHMEASMLQNKGDLVVLSQMADKYLEQASRQTEILTRLLITMQKLKQFSGDPNEQKNLMTDVNSLLEVLDKNQITPFSSSKIVRIEKKEKTAQVEKPLPSQPPSAVEFETDL